jgi:hypothetical protein
MPKNHLVVSILGNRRNRISAPTMLSSFVEDERQSVLDVSVDHHHKKRKADTEDLLCQGEVPLREHLTTAPTSSLATRLRSIVQAQLLTIQDPVEQKKFLGEMLYPSVNNFRLPMPEKIIEMLLKLDNNQIVSLLERPDLLFSRVNEAVNVLSTMQQEQAQLQTIASVPDEMMESSVSLSEELRTIQDPAEQKNFLGERLYYLILDLQPERTAKITGMLLELDNEEIIGLIERADLLKNRVEEAMMVLHEHEEAMQKR